MTAAALVVAIHLLGCATLAGWEFVRSYRRRWLMELSHRWQLHEQMRAMMAARQDMIDALANKTMAIPPLVDATKTAVWADNYIRVGKVRVDLDLHVEVAADLLRCRDCDTVVAVATELADRFAHKARRLLAPQLAAQLAAPHRFGGRPAALGDVDAHH